MITFAETGFFWKGANTLKVPLELFKLNRQRLCEALRAHRTLPSDSIVLLQGGESETRHCTDHEPLFRQESYFHWAFGVTEPDFYGAINVRNGESILFIPRLPPAYASWMGKIKTTEEFKQIYQVDHVFYVDELVSTFQNLVGKDKIILVLSGLNTDSGKQSRPATFDGIDQFHVDNSTLHPIINECRVFKTKFEIEVMRYANKISSDAHKFVMLNIKDGMYEYEIEALFQYYCHRYGAMRHVSYTCICATGANPAILHYGHAGAPNDRKIKSTDMCLFDMGGEYYCYGSDITCSFPVSGRFTDEQRMIYEAVLDANRQVMNNIRPGVSWTDMHLLAERVELQHLKAAGLIKGDIDDMMESRLGSIFMPHGLGHMLGIDTHDVGGYLDPQTRSTQPGLKSLRTNRTLEANMCLTIEPGLYFNEFLLNNAYENEILAKFLVKNEIDRFIQFGGVRIEDDIIVTEDGCELLTKVPRSCDEIENWMQHNSSTMSTKIDFDQFDTLNKQYEFNNKDLVVKKFD